MAVTSKPRPGRVGSAASVTRSQISTRGSSRAESSSCGRRRVPSPSLFSYKSPSNRPSTTISPFPLARFALPASENEKPSIPSSDAAQGISSSDFERGIAYVLPKGTAFDRWMHFISHLATRPTKPMTIIPRIVDQPRAAHLVPPVPGRSVEGFEKDHTIEFGHRLFKKDITRSRRKQVNKTREDLGPPDPLIAALFEDSDTSSCSSDKN